MSFGFSAGDFVAAANLAYKLVLALSESSGSSMEYQQLIQDLSCVHRTLLQVEQMKEACQLNQSTINALKHQVDSAKVPMEVFLEKTEKYRRSLSGGGGTGSSVKDSWRKMGWSLQKKDDVKALRDVLQLRLLSINVLLSTACYFIAQPQKSRSALQREELGSDCTLEDEDSIPTPNWNNDLVVFEHIGLKSGGTRYNDPAFRSRSRQDARDFFRVGQVFMMLWTVEATVSGTPAVADDESSIEEDRHSRMMYANVYTGPYTGPTTVRRFLVVHEGVRSSYCLPVSTLNLQGCSQQPDQENYGIIFTGSMPPPALPGETGMVKPPIQVNASHPSSVLPPQVRIDYRRLCEVEHNVRCKDVGLVDIDSMTNLLVHLQPCRISREQFDDEELDEIE